MESKRTLLVIGAGSVIFKELKKRDFLSKYDNIIMYSYREKIDKNLLNEKFINDKNKVDILHLSGIYEKRELEELIIKKWESILSGNCFSLIETVVWLKKEKKIINNLVSISTILTEIFNANNYMYICSKTLLESFVKQLAYNEGIRANMISPTYFPSKMNNNESRTYENSILKICDIIELLLIKEMPMYGQIIKLNSFEHLGY